MTEEEWQVCSDPEVMKEFFGGGLSARKLRLFAVASVRPFWELLFDQRSRDAVVFAEHFADSYDPVEYLVSANGLAFDAISELPGSGAQVSVAHAAARTTDRNPVLAAQVAWNMIASASAELLEEQGTTDDEQYEFYFRGRANGERVLAGRVRDIFGNPFRPVRFDPAWRTDTALAVARQMYESREFGAAPILADALQDAGCDADDLLNHLRDPHAAHVRGCWALDLVLGKE